MLKKRLVEGGNMVGGMVIEEGGPVGRANTGDQKGAEPPFLAVRTC